jgi:HD-like signal output (HDOD) protein
MVAVASVSRLIAETGEQDRPDEAYLAGLLHDLGLILIDQYMHRQFREVLDQLYDDVPTIRVEREILLFDHAELGAFVARKWELPESIWASAAYHHDPLAYSGPFQRVVKIVSIANYLCCQRGWTSLGVANVAIPSDQVYADLEIGEERIRQIVERLNGVLEGADNVAMI